MAKRSSGKLVRPKSKTAKSSQGKKAAAKRPVASAQPKLDKNAARQRAANAAVMEGRIAKSGLGSHIIGHVSARGRRAQARRDAKNQGES
jgi:hypothetical protein